MGKRVLHPNHLKPPLNFCRLPDGYGVVKLAVSGAAEADHCGLDAYEKAKEVGREVAKAGGIITTGATTGFPLYAAMGAKDECGFSIGFSPAANEREHTDSYKLPLDYMDVVMYTGFGYAGRDLLLVRASDAVIVGCGRVGTFNEFSIAFEDRKPIGILRGSWDTDDLLQRLMDDAHRPNKKVVFDSDPKRLVAKLIDMVLADRRSAHNLVYNNYDSRDVQPSEEVIL